MRKSFQSFARKRWPILALTGTVVGGGAYGVFHLQSLAQAHLPGYLKGQLEAALGRPVEMGPVRLSPTGLRVERFRLPRIAGEAADPVSAKSIRVSADWWKLVARREVRIDDVVLEGAKVSLSAASPMAGKGPWTGQVVRLANTGIQRVGVQDASIQYLADNRGTVAWAAEDVDGSLKLQPERFDYQARIHHFESAGTELAGVRLAGFADEEQLTLSQATLEYGGGSLAAEGTIRVADNATDLQLRVNRMPLAKVAARVGIPQEWAVQGTVTGLLTLDAHDNALRSIKGTVNVTRGSISRPEGQFPWESARAKVDWTPAQATLSDVKVQGDGVSLTAHGTVQTPENRPFTEGEFQLSGRVAAERSGAVSRVAELLAFRRVLEGRWEAGSASVDFQAHGQVKDVSKATATGKLLVRNLRFRPVADQEAATVDHFSAQLERTPDRLVLRDLQAKTDGFTAVGEAVLTDDQPQKPAEFRVDGRVAVKDLKSLRRALPQAALWRWIPVASPRASGELAFKMGGELARPADLWSNGTFEARDFRLSAAAPLPGDAVFFFPVKVAKGSFKHAARQFEIADLDLKASTFGANGRLALDFRGEPAMQTVLNVSTEDWRSLPAMPASALPELTGGNLTAVLKMAAPLSQLNNAPVEGSFRLADASYRPGREGATPLPVEEFAAQFRWADKVLLLPQLTVKTPLVSGSAEGRLYPVTRRDYHVALDLKATSPAVSDLVERFTSEVKLTGGTAEGHFQLDAPVQELAKAVLSGTLDLKDARVSYPVEALGLKEIDTRKLSLDFSRSPQGWQVARVDLDAPGLAASLTGVVATDRVDADLSVQMDQWAAPANLPITGGKVRLLGHVSGQAEKPETLAFSGDLKLDNASLRLSDPAYEVTGGALSLEGGLKVALGQPEAAEFAGEIRVEGARARYESQQATLREGLVSLTATGTGSVSQPERWVSNGSVRLANATVESEGRGFPKVEELVAFFNRDGERLRWKDAKLVAAGSTLESAGWWSPKGHELDLVAQLTDLAPFGVKLPEGVAAKSSRVTVHVTGNPRELVAAAKGSVELTGVRLALGGVPAQALESVRGGFSLQDGVVRLEELKGAGPAGTFTASGTWGEKGQELALLVEGDDFSKLGVELAEGFKLRGFRLQGRLTGTAEQPLERLDARVRLTGAEFAFGPHGPHKLDTLEARVSGRPDNLKLSEIAASGPAGRYTGTGEVTAKGYRVALEVPGMNPDVVRWLLPGEIQGGRLSGTLTLAGDEKEPVRSASGRFELRDAKYVAPETLQIATTATPVSLFSGEYAWDASKTELKNLRVESPLVAASGNLHYAGGEGTLQADLKTADLGAVTDYWPALKAMVAGGSATGQLSTAFKGDSARGTLAVESTGGVLHLPGMTGEFAEHPVEKASLVLGFEPGKLTFNDVKVRGPKGNADGEGSWAPDGAVYGTGKAWFSKSFTSRLMPKGVGWLAKLFGIKQVKSDFTIEGDAEKVHLNAGITRSFLWKFAKGSVPKEFQEIARGKAPLWVKPLETVQQPTTPPAPTAEARPETSQPEPVESKPAPAGG